MDTENANLYASQDVYDILDKIISKILSRLSEHKENDDEAISAVMFGLVMAKDTSIGITLNNDQDLNTSDLVKKCLSHFKQAMEDMNMPFEVNFESLTKEQFEERFARRH